MNVKSFPSLTVEDIKKCPTWRFTNRNLDDDLEIESVLERPCTDVRSLIVGCQLRLADGVCVWGLLQNVDPTTPSRNDHFLTATIDCNCQWFPLARYHDVDVNERGPLALSHALGKDISSIFPLSYDIRSEVGFDAAGLVGSICIEPHARLSRKEIIELALSHS